MPAYNPGPVLTRTVREVLSVWPDLWVVIDGSDDGSECGLERLKLKYPSFRVICHADNRGKGAAVIHAASRALQADYTHALVMDCDGQHPSDRIQDFIDTSLRHPESMVLGQPVFGPEVPRERLWGRQLSVGLAWVEVLGPWIGDPLFGFRVYPLKPLIQALGKEGRGRRYDFDHEASVRMVWAGIPVIRLRAKCRYVAPEEGGVSHFNYLRDNLRLVLLHLRLLPGWLLYLLRLIIRPRTEAETT
jgi:glycosyltransferase involved in cell wall biosynthesis